MLNGLHFYAFPVIFDHHFNANTLNYFRRRYLSRKCYKNMFGAYSLIEISFFT